jgi:hypothetical protein
MSTTLLNANKQLLEIYSEKKKYQRPEEGNKAQINVDKGIFVGTTSELSDWIKNQASNRINVIEN